VKRFGVIRTDRMGDLILALPVAESIKKAVPGAYVAYVVSPRMSGIARACPFIDDVIEYRERAGGIRGMLGLMREVRRRRLDAAIFLRPTLRAALAVLLAGVPLRVGTAYRFYSFLFNRRIPEHRRNAEKHESEYNMSLVGSILPGGVKAGPPRIEIDIGHERSAVETLERHRLERKKFAIVHPGSGGSARNLTPAAYARLTRFIEDELAIKVAVTYGPGEEGLVDAVDALRGKPSNAIRGPDDLLGLAALIENASLFVSGSTGPMHLAAAVGTPTLSFFAPVKSCSPRRWGPLSPAAAVIMPPVPECPTCIGPRCPHFDCMDLIKEGTIAAALARKVR
jgi:heptosyltransferase-3